MKRKRGENLPPRLILAAFFQIVTVLAVGRLDPARETDGPKQVESEEVA